MKLKIIIGTILCLCAIGAASQISLLQRGLEKEREKRQERQTTAVSGSVAAEIEEEESTPATPDTRTPRERAIEILDGCVTIDSHADTPLRLREGYRFNAPSGKMRVTIPAMRSGHASGQYFACWVAQGALTDAGRRAARQRIETLLDLSYSTVANNSKDCGIARTSAEARDLKEQGKIAILLGVENGYGIGKNLDWIDHYKDRGVTYITLCHNGNNDICGSSADKTGRYPGLTEFGKKVVKRMNDIGMVIDLSHASDRTVSDVLEYSAAPVVATHSCSRKLTGSSRNLTDDQIRAITSRGGMVMVAACPGFLRQGGKTATADNFMNHLLHIIDIAGVENVGIGTDFDGGAGIPGFNTPADLLSITERLVKTGRFTDKEIRGILGENYLRLLDTVQSMQQKAQ